MERSAGVLLSITSLPSKYGIGTFSKEAYAFVDKIKEAKVKIWQILPLNPLGYGNSPYQPYSSKAMDELYVSLELLKKEGLIKKLKTKNPFRQKDIKQAEKGQITKIFANCSPRQESSMLLPKPAVFG